MTPSRAALLLALATACAGARTPAPAPTPAERASAARIAADVAWLAAPERAGRPTGSAASDSTAAYLARRYRTLGIPGAFGAACRCADAYVQAFRAGGDPAHNVAARIAGADSTVAEEVVVVGAHLDHIGRATWLSADPEHGAVVRPGADDNASGTAAVLELARRLAERPPRRSVIVAHFDAEELGLFGSRAFVDRPPVPRARVRLMVNLDMVGRLRGDRLLVEIARRERPLAPLVEDAARAAGLRVSYTYETEGRSDHTTFAEWRVPALALFTGFHDDYHAMTDTPSRVNVVGLRRVVDVAERIVRAVADER